MKTKNMRKKALVASLAMLLVAVVALSGATYAWFSANSTANLSSINLQSTTSSSLLIAAKETAPTADEYSNTINVTWEELALIPCSSADTTSFVTVTATGEKADGAAQKVESFGTTTTGFLHKTLWFKTDAASDVRLSALTTTGETLNLSNAIRVALVPAGSSAVVYGIGSPQTYYAVTGQSGYTAGAATYGDLYAGTTGKGVTYSDAVTTKVAGTTSDAFVSLAAGTPKQVDLYVWLEGNDADCVNAIAGGTISGMSFQFDVVS